MDYTGHTIIDGVLKYASVSAVKMFDRRTKGGCPRRWAYRYVFGKKEAEHDASRVAKDKGIALDGKLKHYLRTGDKSLSALALKGLHILETPGPDLWIDVKLHRVSYFLHGRQFEPLPEGERYPEGTEVFIESGLTAAGVPFIGEIDYAHARGHFRNDDGEFEDDPPDTVEVCDLKFKTSAKDREGNSTFMHEADLVRDIQMAGYGEWFRRVRPQTKNARLSLLYYPEQKGLPTKVTKLHVINDCAQTWNYVEGVVANMKDVAREKNIENVPYEASACHAWGQSEKSRCPHAEYCTAYERTAIDSLYSKVATDFKKEPDVGIIASNPQLSPQLTAQAPASDMRAQLAAEEQQMRQQVQQAQQPSLTEAIQRIASFGYGTPTLAGNAAQAYAAAGGQSIAPGVQYPGIPAPAGARRSLHGIALNEAQHVFQILGELERERNQAQQIAQGPAPYVQPTPGPTVQQAISQPPPAQNFTQQVAQAYNTQMQAAPTSFLSPDAPPSMPQLAADSAAPAAPAPVVEAPKATRGRPKKDKSQDAAPVATAAVAAPTTPPSSVSAPAPQAPPAAASTSHVPVEQNADISPGTIILINARVEGRTTKSLAGYVDYINEKLAKMYNTTRDGRQGPLDVRMPVEGSILGFGGWKGAVRTAVKAEPPPDDAYHFDTFYNDLNEIVADALREVANEKGWVFVRGVR
jgi:hypothetical protein